MSETGDAWDAQIAADVKAGRLDWLADEARKEHASGKTVECDMSETPSGLYDVFETSSGKFRRWHSTGTIECMINGTWRSIPSVAQAEITRLRSALASAGIAHDPTAQTEPLTTGQQIVSWWEKSTVSEPCELAQKIDGALASMKEQCARVAERFSGGSSVAAAIRALPSTEGHSPWRGIESAPKIKKPDHEILAYDKNAECYWLARWSGVCWLTEECMKIEPTHWQPLPSPPSEKEGGEG